MQFSSAERAVISTLPPSHREIVRHVQQNQSRKPEMQNGRRQDEMPAEVCRIENQNDGVRLREIRPLTLQNVVCDLLVFGPRVEAVDTG